MGIKDEAEWLREDIILLRLEIRNLEAHKAQLDDWMTNHAPKTLLSMDIMELGSAKMKLEEEIGIMIEAARIRASNASSEELEEHRQVCIEAAVEAKKKLSGLNWSIKKTTWRRAMYEGFIEESEISAERSNKNLSKMVQAQKAEIYRLKEEIVLHGVDGYEEGIE